MKSSRLALIPLVKSIAKTNQLRFVSNNTTTVADKININIRGASTKFPAIANLPPELTMQLIQSDSDSDGPAIDPDPGNIAVLGMNRPSARNAMSRNLLNNLHDCIEQLRWAKTVRVVILHSLVPNIFCAGADLKERHAMSNDGVVQHTLAQRALLTDLENLPMPVIAAVDGAALGGGLEMALACDVRIAASNAKLGLVETRLGLIPGAGGTARLPRVVGLARAKELIYTARVLDGKQAAKIGLINCVVDQNDAGDAAYLQALELAREIITNGANDVRIAKASINRGSQADLYTALAIEEATFAKIQSPT